MVTKTASPRRNKLSAEATAERYMKLSGNDIPVFADQFIADNVSTTHLFVDYTYARPLTKARMLKLDKRLYDTRKVGMLLVSMRNDGTFALIDGQGRMYSALRASVPTVPARVYLDLTAVNCWYYDTTSYVTSRHKPELKPRNRKARP